MFKISCQSKKESYNVNEQRFNKNKVLVGWSLFSRESCLWLPWDFQTIRKIASLKCATYELSIVISLQDPEQTLDFCVFSMIFIIHVLFSFTASLFQPLFSNFMIYLATVLSSAVQIYLASAFCCLIVKGISICIEIVDTNQIRASCSFSSPESGKLIDYRHDYLSHCTPFL